jgi:hypothetical protein
MPHKLNGAAAAPAPVGGAWSNSKKAQIWVLCAIKRRSTDFLRQELLSTALQESAGT